MRRRILLVRHCQSQANADGRIEGRGDSPLSEAGQRQAAAVAAFIAGQDLGEVTLIASTQSRAMATAAAIGAACGWTALHDHRIREGDLGWMEDMAYTEVGKHMAERGARELDAEVHGGESLDDVAGRAWEALGEAAAASDGVLVLVSHGYTINGLLRRLGVQPEAIPRFIGNGDVVEFWLDDAALAGPPRHFPLS